MVRTHMHTRTHTCTPTHAHTHTRTLIISILPKQHVTVSFLPGRGEKWFLKTDFMDNSRMFFRGRAACNRFQLKMKDCWKNGICIFLLLVLTSNLACIFVSHHIINNLDETNSDMFFGVWHHCKQKTTCYYLGLCKKMAINWTQTADKQSVWICNVFWFAIALRTMDIIPAVALGRIMQHVAGTLRWQTFLLSTHAPPLKVTKIFYVWCLSACIGAEPLLVLICKALPNFGTFCVHLMISWLANAENYFLFAGFVEEMARDCCLPHILLDLAKRKLAGTKTVAQHALWISTHVQQNRCVFMFKI